MSDSRKQKPFSVLYLAHEGARMGGASYSLLNMLSALAHDIEPLVILPEAGPLGDVLMSRGIEHHVVAFPFGLTKRRGMLRYVKQVRDAVLNRRAVKRIVELVAGKAIQVVHSNSAALPFGLSVAGELSAAHVWHLREFIDCDFDRQPTRSWAWLHREIGASDAVVCVSESIRRHYGLAGSPHASVVYNAVEKLPKEERSAGAASYLLFAGYMTPQKGVEQALLVMSQLIEQYPKLKLKLAGGVAKGYRPRLNALIQQYNLQGCVEFVGVQSNLAPLMRDALCFLMCSRSEAFGRVTAEAMFSQCPVVAYDSAGSAELLRASGGGLLYKTVDELRACVASILDGECELDIMRRSALSFANQNFVESVYRDKILEIYRSISSAAASENA